MKGIEAQTDTRLDGDRAALIVELRAEREAAVRAADALAAGEAPAPAVVVEHNADTLFKR